MQQSLGVTKETHWPKVPTRRVSLTNDNLKVTSLGLTASQVVRLIGLLLVFASQKIVHYVRNEMAKFVVPWRKEIKDSLTWPGIQNIRGLHRQDLAKGGKRNKYFFLRARSLDMKKHAPHFAQQHKSTYHSGHFHCARWRIPPREYVHANEPLFTLLTTCLGRSRYR